MPVRVALSRFRVTDRADGRTGGRLDEFDFVHAHGAPAGGDQGIDQRGFGGAHSLVLGIEAVCEVVEAFLGFRAEEHGPGEQSVAHRVAGGPEPFLQAFSDLDNQRFPVNGHRGDKA